MKILQILRVFGTNAIFWQIPQILVVSDENLEKIVQIMVVSGEIFVKWGGGKFFENQKSPILENCIHQFLLLAEKASSMKILPPPPPSICDLYGKGNEIMLNQSSDK